MTWVSPYLKMHGKVTIAVFLLMGKLEQANHTPCLAMEKVIRVNWLTLIFLKDKGIIPLICNEMFERIGANHDPETIFKVEVSFMEVRN
jgi:hypothetical protein